MKTLVSSMPILSMEELKEKMLQLNALILKAGSSSAEDNVKKRTFSLKQMVTNIRVADTALYPEQDFCM